MKKKIINSFIMFLLVFSLPLIFFGCKNKLKVLTTPISVGMVKNNEQVLLVTDENIYATGYRFYLTNNSNYENLDNYIMLYSEENSVDITNYYSENVTYHFFVKYVGDNKTYKDSLNSEIKSQVAPLSKVQAPYIQIIDEKVYFFRIMNAQSYELYETITNSNNEVVSSEKALTLNSETFEIDISNRFADVNAPYYTFSYKLKAIAEDGYADSDFSNEITYVKNITLEKPNNLFVTTNDNKYFLNWDKVNYATKYKVIINNNFENAIITDKNKVEITNCLTEYSLYGFKVQAIESDVLSYKESEISEVLEYKFTTNFASPSNLSASRNGEYLNITFDGVSLAQSYTLEIYNNQEEKIYYDNSVTTNNILLGINELFSVLTSDQNITIKLKTNNVGEYYLESSFASLDFTIVKTY